MWFYCVLRWLAQPNGPSFFMLNSSACSHLCMRILAPRFGEYISLVVGVSTLSCSSMLSLLTGANNPLSAYAVKGQHRADAVLGCFTQLRLSRTEHLGVDISPSYACLVLVLRILIEAPFPFMMLITSGPAYVSKERHLNAGHFTVSRWSSNRSRFSIEKLNWHSKPGNLCWIIYSMCVVLVF